MNIGIYLYDEAEVLDFSGPFEVFSTASRVCGEHVPFTVFLVGETGAAITARGGYTVLPHYGFGSHPPIDVLVVAGGVHHGEMNKPAVIEWLTHQSHTASTVTSVCTGAFLLAAAGVLDSRTVTTHWEDRDELQRLFPRLTVIGGVRWVEAGKVVTSAGIAAGIDMSLHLVGRLHSRSLAQQTARQMEFPWTPAGDRPR